MAESPLKTARILWIAAAVTTVAAALVYFDVFAIGEFSKTFALLLLVVAVMDVAMSAVILRRRS
jgi:uncharacterized membrane protein